MSKLTRKNAKALKNQRPEADRTTLLSGDYVAPTNPPASVADPIAQQELKAALIDAADANLVESMRTEAANDKPTDPIVCLIPDRETTQEILAENRQREEANKPKLEIPARAPNKQLTQLARKYLTGALESMTRTPAPALVGDFRTTVLLWRDITIAAIKCAKDQPTGLIIMTVLSAYQAANDSLNVIRYSQQLMRQCLFAGTMDIQRDRRSAGDSEEEHGMDQEPYRTDATTQPLGQDPLRDPSYIAPPTEDECIDALEEVNLWLCALVDALITDQTQREFFNLAPGLPYTTHMVDTILKRWEPVYSAAEAVAVQIEVNQVTMRKRAARQVQKNADALAALAALG